MELGSFPVKSQNMTLSREGEMEALMSKSQKANHPRDEVPGGGGSWMLLVSAIRN